MEENVSKVKQESTSNAHEENISQVEITKYTTKEWFISALLGVFIGLAIIVPGVSGATIAIIFGLYYKLIYSLSNLTKEFKKCFMFLLPIGIGAVVGLVVGFFAVQKLFEVMPFTIVCLFAGLMVGAFPAVSDEIRGVKITPAKLTLLIIGVIVPVAISVGSIFLVGNSNDAVLNVTLGLILLYIPLGMVISVTQILPGLSATALLMAFGQFGPLLESLSISNIKNNPMLILVYLALIVGFVVGIVAFSKFLNFLLKTKKDHTFYTIVGLSAGSIISMFINPDIYSVYLGWNNGTQDMWLDLSLGFVLFFIGGVCAYLLVRFERKRKQEKMKTEKTKKENADLQLKKTSDDVKDEKN